MQILEDFILDPRELGFRISVVDRPFCRCPFCFADVKMAVHEHGVQWACGCARMLPQLHLTSGGHCSRCPTLKHVVVPFRPQVNIACITRKRKQKLSA